MMQKLVVIPWRYLHGNTLAKDCVTLLTESLPVNVLELQLEFLFKERQLPQIFSEVAVWKRSLKQLFLNISQILWKLSVVECFCSLKLKKYIPQQTISSYISQIFQNSFSNTSGQLLTWNKKPPRSSRPKEFLEIAVLKYLRKLPSIIKFFGS